MNTTIDSNDFLGTIMAPVKSESLIMVLGVGGAGGNPFAGGGNPFGGGFDFNGQTFNFDFGNGSPLDDILGNIFGFGGGARRPRRGDD